MWLRVEPITFSIMVQKGGKNFEILENGQLVASGRIYVPNNARKEMLNIVKPPEGDIILDELDFYRYVLIRNYNFKGAFRSIKKINSEGKVKYLSYSYITCNFYNFCENIFFVGTRASVAWSRNWVTYLDGILQVNLLAGDVDCLSVPIAIEKIVIDTDKHEQMLRSKPSGTVLSFTSVVLIARMTRYRKTILRN